MYNSAFYDALTELPNRRLFERTFNDTLRSAQRLEGQVGMLFIDLDHFKTINDDYGHQVGDHLLQLVAKRLCNVLGGNDFVARLSGDEFVVVLSYLGSVQALERIEARIHGAFSQPFNLHGVNIRVRCSIGHALFPQDGSSVKTLCAVADRRMYEEKVEHHRHAPQVVGQSVPAEAQ